MTRRRRHVFRDPTGDQGLAGFPTEQLYSVLDTMSEREAGVVSMLFGLVDGSPSSVAEVAKFYGVTDRRIEEIAAKTMLKLQHTSRSAVLVDYNDGGRIRPAPRKATGTWVLCKKHGWTLEERPNPCPQCPCSVYGPYPWAEPGGSELLPKRRVGRPPKYCSDACQQVAYRKRLKARRQGTG